MSPRKNKAQSKNFCTDCGQKQEKCADSRSCTSWRTSYDVCIMFGTRLAQPGFKGAAYVNF